jgi:hypothetical protein
LLAIRKALALWSIPSSLLRRAFLLTHPLQDIEVAFDILVRARACFAAQTSRQNRGGDLVSIGHVSVSRCLSRSPDLKAKAGSEQASAYALATAQSFFNSSMRSSGQIDAIAAHFPPLRRDEPFQFLTRVAIGSPRSSRAFEHPARLNPVFGVPAPIAKIFFAQPCASILASIPVPTVAGRGLPDSCRNVGTWQSFPFAQVRLAAATNSAVDFRPLEISHGGMIFSEAGVDFSDHALACR